MAAQPPPLVLVADNSDEVRAELERRLGERGYRVASAGEGAQALELVAREVPDVVLLDYELAGIDGMAVLDRLRADDELAAVPVIMLTQLADPELLVEALRRGAHDYLRKPFDPSELDARVMAALRVKRLHDALLEANRKLAEQALTDDLTRLANRRHGAHQLEREIALGVRHGRDLALVRVDVDHFKAINDTHGHQAGDQVLAEVARRLAGAVRGGDELARWGGDEFVAILPGTDRPGALRAAERLRAAVAEAPIEIVGASLPVTVSVGWAHWAGDTPDDLLARADRALYKAKDAGRDMVFPLRASGPQV
jgi:two-component system cell cycle response regulator